MILSKKRLLLGTYLFVAMVFVPLLAPLRQLQIFEPALILMVTIPLIVFLTLMVLGSRILTFRSYLSFFLIFTFMQAALVGFENATGGGLRSYLSHLFQLFSAVVMVAAGAHWSDDFGKKFWSRFAVIALLSVSISTVMSLRVWAEGDISRYYTPAYILIFVVAVGLADRPKGTKLTLFSILVGIISNKRAPLLSVITMMLTYYFARMTVLRRLPLSVNKGTALSLAFLLVATPAFLISQQGSTTVGSNTVERAFDQTFSRLTDVISFNDPDYDLNAVSAGRVHEINLALDSIDELTLIIGNGAGWTAFRDTEAEIQNIHFSPLSLVVVFGLPFAVFFYAYVIYLIARNFSYCIASGTFTEKIAVYYLTGSVLHTLFAYSIFIDILNFFFIGVLVNAARRRRAYRTVGIASRTSRRSKPRRLSRVP